VNSGGTFCHAAKALKEAGAAQVFAYGTHGVLSGDANERIQKSELQSLTLTNSISLRMTDPIPHIYTLSIAYFLAEAIRRIHCEESVADLFK